MHYRSEASRRLCSLKGECFMISPIVFFLLTVPTFEAPVIVESVENLASPVIADWDGDGLPDLIVSEGFDVNPNPDPFGMGDPCYGHFRLYLNQGTPGYPEFPSHTYLQSGGTDIEVYST